jgi:hypothetical protein
VPSLITIISLITFDSLNYLIIFIYINFISNDDEGIFPLQNNVFYAR